MTKPINEYSPPNKAYGIAILDSLSYNGVGSVMKFVVPAAGYCVEPWGAFSVWLEGKSRVDCDHVWHNVVQRRPSTHS